jgi:hypothetical protein
MNLAHLASIPVLGFLTTNAFAQDVLVHGYAVDASLHFLDPAALAPGGAIAPPAPAGLPDLLSLGYGGQGIFYGLMGVSSTRSVVRIDTEAVAISVVGDTNISWYVVGSAFDLTTGSMYVIGSPLPPKPVLNLYRVDLTNGNLTLVTPTTASIDPRTFTIDVHGHGYGFSGYGSNPGLPFHPRLWAIDLTTGQATVVASFDSVLIPDGTQFHSSAVRADGTAWLATEHGLWQLDPTTSTGVQLSSAGYDEIAFAPATDVGVGYASECYGSHASCPCSSYNFNPVGNGCANSISNIDAVGGNLRAFGAASLSNDTLSLVAANLPNSSGVAFQGSTLIAPTPYGAGLLCAGGAIIRLGGGLITNNVLSYPSGNQLPVSVQGHVTTPGTFYYQTLYRDSANPCNGRAFNLTNSISVTWVP